VYSQWPKYYCILFWLYSSGSQFPTSPLLYIKLLYPSQNIHQAAFVRILKNHNSCTFKRKRRRRRRRKKMRPASSVITFFLLLFISIYILKKTLKTFPRSSITIALNYVVFIVNQLKWAWEILLLQSFSHPYNLDPDHELKIMHYEPESESSGSVECAVCLCKIEEGEEVRELRCDHLFHRVCLDRWIGTGRMTCPLCRNHLKPSPLVANLHQEVILFDFVSGTRSIDRYQWWIR